MACYWIVPKMICSPKHVLLLNYKWYIELTHIRSEWNVACRFIKEVIDCLHTFEILYLNCWFFRAKRVLLRLYNLVYYNIYFNLNSKLWSVIRESIQSFLQPKLCLRCESINNSLLENVKTPENRNLNLLNYIKKFTITKKVPKRDV